MHRHSAVDGNGVILMHSVVSRLDIQVRQRMRCIAGNQIQNDEQMLLFEQFKNQFLV